MERTLHLSEKFISKSKIFWTVAEKVNFIFHFWLFNLLREFRVSFHSRDTGVGREGLP